MQYGEYLRLDFYKGFVKSEKGGKIVKLSNPNENSVLILVKTKKRNPENGKFTYGTEKSLELFQTTPAEVIAAVEKMLEKETGEKLPAPAAAAAPAAKGKK